MKGEKTWVEMYVYLWGTRLYRVEYIELRIVKGKLENETV